MRDELVDAAADNTSVPADTGQIQNNQHGPEPAESAYTPAERAAIDQANEIFGAVIKAVDTFQKIESWVPLLIRGVRALRDRAMRETGALNYMDNQYRKTFRDLLNAEQIGPWLLAKNRRGLFDAVKYLGRDDAYLETFMDWWRTKITDKQRQKWLNLHTLVDHFKEWQNGTVANNDRRTPEQKEIERVRTEGHKAEAALVAEVEQVRQELATLTVESTETLWTTLEHAGPEKFVQTLKDHAAKDYARAVYNLLGRWLKEPTT